MQDYKNDNELIDEILTYIKKSDLHSVALINHTFRIKERPANNNERAILHNKISRILQLMRALELIDYDNSGIIKLTNKGTIIYYQGGYQKYWTNDEKKAEEERRLRSEEVDAAKRSADSSESSAKSSERSANYAKWAMWVSVGVVVISIYTPVKEFIINFLNNYAKP